MNYFGLFFSFMIPGIILGCMAAVAIEQEAKRRKKQRRAEAPRRAAAPRVAEKGKLYIHDLNAAA